MNLPKRFCRTRTVLLAVLATYPPLSLAGATEDVSTSRMDELQLKLEALEKQVHSSAEWRSPSTLIHMAGYADTGYASVEGGDDSFVVGSFSPIFHFQYRDIVMLESELEFEVGEDGETETNLEYLTIDWFINDYTALVVGKFLSPVGQFRQNLHPSWINKLPSAPPGFGHDGAAPVSDVGAQLRGGFPAGNMRANYALYVSNGPELNAVTEDGADFELEGIRAEGFGSDSDGEKTVGGRLGILPFPSLEIGLSLVTGKASVTQLEVEADPDAGGPLSDASSRSYDVSGVDFVWHGSNVSLRGEYVKAKLGAATAGEAAGDGASWQTWYVQGSYRWPASKWESVFRYTDFDSPHAAEDQKQTALGVNYLVTNNFIFKAAYEFNDGQAGSPSDSDRTLLQLAYGF